MTADVQFHSLFTTFAEISEVFDKYLLIAGLLLFFSLSATPSRAKRSILWIILLSFLVARLIVTPIVHFLYYEPSITSLTQLRLLISEQNDWPFPNGHAAFLLAIATALYLHNQKWGMGFFLVALALNISRIVAGVHSLPDMLGGMIIGIGTAYGMCCVVEKRRAKEIPKRGV